MPSHMMPLNYNKVSHSEEEIHSTLEKNQMNFKNLGYIPNPSPSMKMYQGATPTNSTSATGFLIQKSPILKQEYMFGNQNQMNASPFQDEKKRTKLNIVNFLREHFIII